MNKKGFSLVEMISIIIIIAFVALLTMPVVLEVLNSSKKSAFETTAYGILEDLRLKAMTEFLDYQTPIKVYNFPTDEIKIEGTQPKGGQAKVNKVGKIELAVHNEKWCALKGINDNTITILDYDPETCKFSSFMVDTTPIITESDMEQECTGSGCGTPETLTMPIVGEDEYGNRVITYTVYSVGYVTNTSTTGTKYTFEISNIPIDLTKYTLKVVNKKIMDTETEFENYIDTKNSEDTTSLNTVSINATASDMYSHSMGTNELILNNAIVKCDSNKCQITVSETFQNLSGKTFHTTTTSNGNSVNALYHGIKITLEAEEIKDTSLASKPELGNLTPIKLERTMCGDIHYVNSDDYRECYDTIPLTEEQIKESMRIKNYDPDKLYYSAIQYYAMGLHIPTTIETENFSYRPISDVQTELINYRVSTGEGTESEVKEIVSEELDHGKTIYEIASEYGIVIYNETKYDIVLKNEIINYLVSKGSTQEEAEAEVLDLMNSGLTVYQIAHQNGIPLYEGAKSEMDLREEILTFGVSLGLGTRDSIDSQITQSLQEGKTIYQYATEMGLSVYGVLKEESSLIEECINSIMIENSYTRKSAEKELSKLIEDGASIYEVALDLGVQISGVLMTYEQLFEAVLSNLYTNPTEENEAYIHSLIVSLAADIAEVSKVKYAFRNNYFATKWVIADTNEQWYNYTAKQWANAVVLKDSSSYKNPGQEIKEDEIELWFVWVPRYEYILSGDSIGSKTDPKALAIKFINSEVITADTGYTLHNGFKFGDTWKNGIWVGKFSSSTGIAEVCSDEYNEDTEPCNSIEKISINNNLHAWSYVSIYNAFESSRNLETNYKLSGLDSHLTRYTELTAVTYLTNSTYGRCIDSNHCEEVSLNPTYTFSGGGNYKANNLQSTTGNTTGVYDMHSTTKQMVMGYMDGEYCGAYYDENREVMTKDCGFNASNIPEHGKYVDAFVYNGNKIVSLNGSTDFGGVYNEISNNVNGIYWYGDKIETIYNNEDSPAANTPKSKSWYVIGGQYNTQCENNTTCGLYASGGIDGTSLDNASSTFRVALVTR